MSCDIHAYIEIKEPNQSKQRWHLAAPFTQQPHKNREYHELQLDRDYDIFAQLANVRNMNGLPAIDDPRGLPDDCTADIKNEFSNWGIDAHSESYLGLDELTDWLANHLEIKDDERDVGVRPNPIADTIKAINDTCQLFNIDPSTYGLNKIRLIFWFDN